MPRKEAPGVLRLRAMDAKPRLEPRRVVQSIVTANLPQQPVRRPRKAAPEQAALF